MKLDHHSYIIHHNKHKMDKRLIDISHDTINVLEENMNILISDIPHSDIFVNISPRASEIRENVNK